MLTILTLLASAAPPESLTVALGEGGPEVLVLHGLGGEASSFSTVFEGMPGPARLLIPSAPYGWGSGRSWLPTGASLADLTAAADALAATLSQPVAVTGFSQGGALSFVLALRHPERILAAIPISGAMPMELVPATAPTGGGPPIIALHGTEDAQVPISKTRKLVRTLHRRGFDATLRSYPGVGHSIPPQVRADLSVLLTALSRSDAPGD